MKSTNAKRSPISIGLLMIPPLKGDFADWIQLPAGVAAVSAVATTAAITTSATVTTSATTEATATFRAGLGLGFVHADGATIQRLPVERVNRCLALLAVRHLNEAKPLRATGHAIRTPQTRPSIHRQSSRTRGYQHRCPYFFFSFLFSAETEPRHPPRAISRAIFYALLATPSRGSLQFAQKARLNAPREEAPRGQGRRHTGRGA